MDYAWEVELPMRFVTNIMQKFGNTSPAERMHENKLYTSSSAPAASAPALGVIAALAS